MLGALIGDIVGSRFEFNNIKTKDFDLFDPKCSVTDDSVMSVAIADICNQGLVNDKKGIIKTLKKWGVKYPDAGYGARFYHWVLSNDSLPYNSCGNGSAMRISSIGWYAKSKDEVIEFSKYVTEVTHNHPEGIKGAEVTAMMIYMARNGATKEELREYAVGIYPEIENLDYEELKKTYFHGQEICQVTLPQALYCFLISNNFEDCIRTTISIGGDCDTTAAISGAIAEAYYGIPENIEKDVRKFIPEDMWEVVADFRKKYVKNG